MHADRPLGHAPAPRGEGEKRLQQRPPARSIVRRSGRYSVTGLGALRPVGPANCPHSPPPPVPAAAMAPRRKDAAQRGAAQDADERKEQQPEPAAAAAAGTPPPSGGRVPRRRQQQVAAAGAKPAAAAADFEDPSLTMPWHQYYPR
jgi:hypothetical protein